VLCDRRDSESFNSPERAGQGSLGASPSRGPSRASALVGEPLWSCRSGQRDEFWQPHRDTWRCPCRQAQMHEYPRNHGQPDASRYNAEGAARPGAVSER
jgi:hypothetical protein